MKQREFSKEDLFRFIAHLGVFCALEMNLPAFYVLDQTALALLKQAGLLEDFVNFQSEIGIPTTHLMTVGIC